MDECLSVVPHKITVETHQTLTSEFSADEIKTALFQMIPTKAPCPDGMNALFFQKYWHIVGNNVIDTVLDFLESGHIVPGINSTNIVLILKVKSPKKCLIFALLAFVM